MLNSVCEILVLNLLLELLPMSRSFSNHTLVVLGPNDVFRHNVLPILIKQYAHNSEFNIPDSSGTVRSFQVCADDGMYPKGRTSVLHL